MEIFKNNITLLKAFYSHNRGGYNPGLNVSGANTHRASHFCVKFLLCKIIHLCEFNK